MIAVILIILFFMSESVWLSHNMEISHELQSAMNTVFKNVPRRDEESNTLWFERKIAWTVLYWNEADWENLNQKIFPKIQENSSMKKLLRNLIEWVVHHRDPNFDRITWTQQQKIIIKDIKERFPWREWSGITDWVERIMQDKVTVVVQWMGKTWIQNPWVQIEVTTENYGANRI